MSRLWVAVLALGLGIWLLIVAIQDPEGRAPPTEFAGNEPQGATVPPLAPDIAPDIAPGTPDLGATTEAEAESTEASVGHAAAPPVLPAEVGDPLGDDQGRIDHREGARDVVLYRDTRRLAEFGAEGEARPPVPGARSLRHRQRLRIWELPESVRAWDVLADQARVEPERRLSPLYFRTPTRQGSALLLPGGITVQFPDGWTSERVAAFAAREGLQGMSPLSVGPTWYAFSSPPGEGALRLAMRIQALEEVVLAKPDWAERRVPK